MSDLSIPGVKSKYDTEKIIEDLMKVERVPKTRAEEELKRLEERSSVWLDLNARLSRLRDSSRTLFSFANPFSERKGNSSDQDVLTATATREAIEETRSIQVMQVAQADRFLSASLPSDYKVPAGTYGFGAGDKSFSFKYSGGSLADFAEAVNRRGKDIVRAQVISVEKGRQSLLIESLLTGSTKRLSFSGASEALVQETGIMERSPSSERAISLDASSPKALDGSLDRNKVSVKEGVLSVLAGGRASISLGSPLPSDAGLVLELEYRTILRPGDRPPEAPAGPSIPATGGVEYQGIRIQSEAFEVPLPAWTPPPVPPPEDDLSMLSAIISPSGEAALPELSDAAEFTKITIPLSGLGGSIVALGLRNDNTHRDLELRGLRVYDPAELGGLRPSHPVSTAADAVILMDGIRVSRETNSISDLIPGVTLELHGASEKAVKLTIEPDREAAKEAVIKWVGFYNQLMTELNVLMSTDQAVISELSGYDQAEKDAMKARLGLLQGDFTLKMIKDSLRSIAMDSYPTGLGTQLALLQQMGVSTNAQGTGGSGYDPARLRGYLEVDEAKLDEALRSRMAAIKQLFGNDTDADLLVDSGVAFRTDALLKPYVETGGIVSQRRSTLSSQIERQKRSIETMEEQLARKEAEYKRKYGLMEGALNQMERTSRSIDNFSQRNRD